MTPARDATTLPKRPLVVNSPSGNSPTDNSMLHKRCEARMHIVYDNSLSPGARLLYIALDDYAGMNALAWPQQATLAKRFKCSEKSICRQASELECAGYVQIQRRQRGVRYLLQWRLQAGSDASGQETSDQTILSGGKSRPDIFVWSDRTKLSYRERRILI
jgi:hypothetical protein